MDRSEKKRLRDRIGEHLDVSGTRLTDDEAILLDDFVSDYDRKYRGQTKTQTSSHTGFSSDGKYIRSETSTDTFTDDMSLRQDHNYQDDDGQSGSTSTETRDARTIVNWLQKHT